jgi:hypothetical protein
MSINNVNSKATKTGDDSFKESSYKKTGEQLENKNDKPDSTKLRDTGKKLGAVSRKF